MDNLPTFRPTADLCDERGDAAAVLEPGFHEYGGRSRFSGPVATLRVPEDNALVRSILSNPGQGRVLVVDGGGSRRCALVGGNLGALAEANGWAGVVVNGCVRDVAELRLCRIGVRALATHPRKSGKQGLGERDVELTFAGATIRPGDWLCADEDGIVIVGPALRT